MAVFSRLGFSREDAKDLTQDTFFSVFGSMQRGGDIEHVKSYLLGAARNIAYNDVRRRKAAKRRAIETSLDGSPVETDIATAAEPGWPKPAPPPEIELIEREEVVRRRRALQRAIEELPDSLRQCLLLQLQGLKMRQIAASMRLSLDAVKSRLYQARQALKGELGEAAENGEWPAELTEETDDP